MGYGPEALRVRVVARIGKYPCHRTRHRLSLWMLDPNLAGTSWKPWPCSSSRAWQRTILTMTAQGDIVTRDVLLTQELPRMPTGRRAFHRRCQCHCACAGSHAHAELATLYDLVSEFCPKGVIFLQAALLAPHSQPLRRAAVGKRDRLGAARYHSVFMFWSSWCIRPCRPRSGAGQQEPSIPPPLYHVSFLRGQSIAFWPGTFHPRVRVTWCLKADSLVCVSFRPVATVTRGGSRSSNFLVGPRNASFLSGSRQDGQRGVGLHSPRGRRAAHAWSTSRESRPHDGPAHTTSSTPPERWSAFRGLFVARTTRPSHGHRATCGRWLFLACRLLLSGCCDLVYHEWQRYGAAGLACKQRWKRESQRLGVFCFCEDGRTLPNWLQFRVFATLSGMRGICTCPREPQKPQLSRWSDTVKGWRLV